MDRRAFLFRSASLVAGSFLGLSGISKAFGKNVPNSSASPIIALIIDDIGFSTSCAKQFLDLGAPITFSILPRLEKSRDLAMEIHEYGHEIMLHQPMEPCNPEVNPGPGALYSGFTTPRIGSILEKNICSVPFAIGVNNHMGSKFTECQKEVNVALTIINEVGLFFVDSMTTSRSTAYETAKRLHMPAACRNMFLDNIQNEQAILSQLARLAGCALEYGHAIGIGHPYPVTARAISRFVNDYEAFGVSLVHVSKILSLRNAKTDEMHMPTDTVDYT